MLPAGITTVLPAFGVTPETQVCGLDHKPPIAVAVAVLGKICVNEKVPGHGLLGVGQVSNIM